MINTVELSGLFSGYSVTPTGLVLSHKGLKPRILKVDYSNKGYARVSLTVGGLSKRFYVHRLVGFAFLNLDIFDSKSQINHKDGIKSNNQIDNLEIMNSSENHKHAYRTLLRKSSVPKGCNSKLAFTYLVTHPDGRTETIRGLNDFCKNSNLSPTKLSEVSRGLRNHHKNFKAERINHV